MRLEHDFCPWIVALTGDDTKNGSAAMVRCERCHDEQVVAQERDILQIPDLIRKAMTFQDKHRSCPVPGLA